MLVQPVVVPDTCLRGSKIPGLVLLTPVEFPFLADGYISLSYLNNFLIVLPFKHPPARDPRD